MNTRYRSEGFFTLITLIAMIALLFSALNDFPSKEPELNEDESGSGSLPGDSGSGGSGNEGTEGGGNEGTGGGSGGGNEGSGSGDSDNTESDCQHVDADDDGFCDECGAEFSDGEDVTEPEEPEEPTPPEEDCEHRDSDDDGCCDECGAEFSDGDECEHRDADDDGYCENCGEQFSDCEENSHVDANGDSVCDECGKEFSFSYDEDPEGFGDYWDGEAWGLPGTDDTYVEKDYDMEYSVEFDVYNIDTPWLYQKSYEDKYLRNGNVSAKILDDGMLHIEVDGDSTQCMVEVKLTFFKGRGPGGDLAILLGDKTPATDCIFDCVEDPETNSVTVSFYITAGLSELYISIGDSLDVESLMYLKITLVDKYAYS